MSSSSNGSVASAPQKAHIDNLILSLRRTAGEIFDDQRRVDAWIRISGITGDPTDRMRAKDVATESKRTDLLGVVGQAFALMGFRREALEVAGLLHDVDYFRYVELTVRIAQASGMKEDAQKAKRLLSHINTPHLRDELAQDVECLFCESGRAQDTSAYNGPLNDDISSMGSLENVEKLHSMLCNLPNSSLRFEMLEHMARILIEK
jgi:hypothetical protein